PLYDITRLVGINFTCEGVELRPTLLQDSYKFSSSLIGLEKTKNGYSGWYNPVKEDTWKLSLELSNRELEKIDFVLINGNEKEFTIEESHVFLIGESKLDKPLSWEIKFK
ncbi:unnamed protein product, partial [marine sediment metagenome]